MHPEVKCTEELKVPKIEKNFNKELAVSSKEDTFRGNVKCMDNTENVLIRKNSPVDKKESLTANDNIQCKPCEIQSKMHKKRPNKGDPRLRKLYSPHKKFKEE